MNRLIKSQVFRLTMVFVVAAVCFGLLYADQMVKIEQPNVEKLPSSLQEWTIEDSDLTGRPLVEDKSIYSDGVDNSIYDVYLNVFPTEDENGKLLDFSAFALHQARDHTYNPVLKCNIQIMDEGDMLDPTLITDVPNATIRVRGNSSRGAAYKSYKIKAMGNNDLFKGQSSLNINKHSSDNTRIATKFSTDLLVGIDNISGYRTNFMRVWIKDSSKPEDEQEYKLYGLYTHTEQPNKTYLEARGLSSDCQMYKARNFSFMYDERLKNVTDPDYSEEEFDEVLTIREGNSHTKVLEMIAAVNDMSGDFEEIFAKYFNEDNYLTWLGFNLLMGADDIINHNFIIYSPNNSSTWYIQPWDFDGNLQGEISYVAPSLRGGQKLNSVLLHRRYLRMPGSLEKLDAKMQELMNTAISPQKIAELCNLYLPVLERTITIYPELDRIRGTPNDVYNRIINFDTQIQENYQRSKDAFEFPAPMYVAIPNANPDGTLHLQWEPSHSYQGRTITYEVKIYDEYTRQTVLYEASNLIDVQCDTNITFAPGTYYLDVRPKDSTGNLQYSLEQFELEGVQRVYENGLLEFTVK